MASSSLVPSSDQILVEENGSTRTITLNRPRQLNVLSPEMILQLLKLYTSYEKDSTVKLLIIKGKGRAFCAGGDISALVQPIIGGHWTLAAKLYWHASILAYIVATYKKPQISIINGMVMGGGAGLSRHGRFRVVTENSVFAMPETALGFFPDIGASYFLSRLSGFFGEYVGLTGAKLDGAEMLACGFATHFVPSSKLPMLEESLTNLDTSDPFAVCAIIDQFSRKVLLKEKSAYNRLDAINRCFCKRTVEGIVYALEQEVITGADEWITVAIQSLKEASPTSLKISLRSIREGRIQRIEECIIREYRTTCHIFRGEVSKDFFEGYRAILIDKDSSPKWEPSRLDLIDDEMVDRCFSRVDEPGWEDVKLPVRCGVALKSESKL